MLPGLSIAMMQRHLTEGTWMVIRVGVVGCGWFGRAHCRTYKTLSGVELAAVADRNKQKALEAARDYSCRAYSSLEEMLKREKLDAVSIAVTPQMLTRVAIEAAREGVGILLEKPLATSLSEYEELYKVVKKAGCMLMPGFIELFNPAYRALKNAIRCEIGELYLLSSKRIGWNPKREVKWEVGVIHDLAIHDIYLFRDICGEPSKISCRAGYILNSKFEDIAVITMEFPSGVLGIIETNWLTPTGERTLRATGSKGSAEVDFLAQSLDIKFRERTVKPHIRREEPLRVELQAFIDGIRRGEADLNEEDGLSVWKILQQAIDAARERL
ncbi:MAG: gfo/Idh/MocA family oxidoreductase [Thermoproteota archaeon]|nr:MAG: gfo/Idh/MocA family oxidoreductase [Candidatus Korarchaeota archaeon]